MQTLKIICILTASIHCASNHENNIVIVAVFCLRCQFKMYQIIYADREIRSVSHFLTGRNVLANSLANK